MIRLVFVCIMLALMAQGAYAEEAFSAGDRVQTTDILHVRGAPGTSSPEIDTMIKGAVGTVVEGPVSKEGYNWWNICYDLGTTGWSAENWLEKALTEPQPPSDFALWSENAIKWSEEHNGKRYWWDEAKEQGYCLRFVANAFMQEYVEGQSVWNSAIEAAATLYRFNQEPGGWTNAPRGAVILFDKEGKNNYGHVGIYLGEGQIIHAYGTVQSTTIESAMAYPDVGRYLGWSYPPDAWRPKTAGINQQTQTTLMSQETNVAIDEDISCLATALMSEASVGTNEERVAVAWTIFNRVKSSSFPNSICEVVNQRSQYATNQKPTQEILDLATSLISDRGVDPTAGAVFFFSPISMPKEGEATGGYDIGGGLHEVAGIDDNVYFPSFALTNEPAGEIPGVRPEYYMFYRDRATSDQVTLTLYVHDGSADGPVLSGAEVTGQDATGSSFSQTTDANGLVVIMGKPGSWQFTVTKTGYAANSWPQEITETCTKQAYLFVEDKMTEQLSENEAQQTSQDAIFESKARSDSELGDLIKALKDEDAEVRLKAAKTLGEIKNSEAVGPLIDALSDENWHVRKMAAWALGESDVRNEAKKALLLERFGGSTLDIRSVNPIIRALDDEDAAVRIRAAQALGEINNSEAVDPLIKVLGDEDWHVRDMAAWALGEINDERGIDPLSYLSVKDVDSDVRNEAKKALLLERFGGSTLDIRSVNPIIRALDDEDATVRLRAVQALGEIKNSEAVDPLIEVLGDEDWHVREMAAWALGEIGDDRAVDPLSYLSVNDTDSDVRNEAKKALINLGWKE